jgi:CMP-N,N'-diacetyllegionaminic acid synthase
MKILLIGYGSIAKRHEEVLLTFKNVEVIEIVTKQNLLDRIIFKSLEDIGNLDKYDYFVIASETSKHYDQLIYLNKKVKNKKIFCEKPLFDTNKNLIIENNKIFVGYSLRFHPLLEKLKKLLRNEEIVNVNIQCGQYLPNWRPSIDYRKSYSAFKNQGGGVLLDLSHEIDYLQCLFGEIKELKSYQVKISDLEIDSDDFTTFIGKTINNIMVNVSMNYISKITHRVMRVDTLEKSYKLDFINNRLIVIDKEGKELLFETNKLKRNDMFKSMHQSILENKSQNCTFDEAKSVMNTINKIQEQNNG